MIGLEKFFAEQTLWLNREDRQNVTTAVESLNRRITDIVFIWEDYEKAEKIGVELEHLIKVDTLDRLANGPATFLKGKDEILLTKRSPKGFQLTYFDEDGPVMHKLFDDLKSASNHVAKENMIPVNKEILKYIN